MEQFQYTKEDLEKRLKIIAPKGEKIEKCLEYALERLVEYHKKDLLVFLEDLSIKYLLYKQLTIFLYNFYILVLLLNHLANV